MRRAFEAKRTVAAAALAGAFALAAPAPAAALSNDEIANLAGPERRKILEDGARKEGEVLWLGSLSVDQTFTPAAAQFESLHPGVKVRFVRADSSVILQRLMAEKQTRSLRTDVIVADIAPALKAADLAQPFASPLLAEYPPAYVAPDRTWVSIRTAWQGIAWNTNLVKEAEAPKTWEALVEPQWKGKLIWGQSANTGGPRLITHLRKIWDEERTTAYLKKLKGQDIRSSSASIRNILDQVVAGEFAVGVSMAMHHIALSQSKGAPVGGISPEPSPARGGALQVIKGAPHPHAAMLLADYILSRDGGQKVLRDSLENPSHPAVEPRPELRWIQPSLNGRTELLLSDEEVEALTPRSVEIYQQIFR